MTGKPLLFAIPIEAPVTVAGPGAIYYYCSPCLLISDYYYFVRVPDLKEWSIGVTIFYPLNVVEGGYVLL